MAINPLRLAFFNQVQSPPTHTSEQRQGQPVAVINNPLSSSQRVISNGIAQRDNAVSGPGAQNVEPQPVRGRQAVVRSIPGDRLIGVTKSIC